MYCNMYGRLKCEPSPAFPNIYNIFFFILIAVDIVDVVVVVHCLKCLCNVKRPEKNHFIEDLCGIIINFFQHDLKWF